MPYKTGLKNTVSAEILKSKFHQFSQIYDHDRSLASNGYILPGMIENRTLFHVSIIYFNSANIDSIIFSIISLSRAAMPLGRLEFDLSRRFSAGTVLKLVFPPF